MDLNEDGLVPGEQVDLETIKRVEREREQARKAAAAQEPDDEGQAAGRYKKHRGGGRYDVYEADGSLAAESLSKAEADELIARQ